MAIETSRDDTSTCDPCNCIYATVMGCDMCLNGDRETRWKKEELEQRARLIQELIPDPFIHFDLGQIDLGGLKGLLPDEGKEKQ